MHPFEDLIDPEVRKIGEVIDALIDVAYPEMFKKLKLDPRRHGFRFVRDPLDVLRVTSNPHPMRPSIRYDRAHSKHGPGNLSDQFDHLKTMARLDRLKDALRGAGRMEQVLPAYMLRVPTMLRLELDRRGITGRQLLDLPHKGAAFPQMLRIGARTDPLSTSVTKMKQDDAGAFPDSGPSMLLRCYIDHIDVVMMELAPGVVIEEEVGGHQIRLAGNPLPATAINSIGTLSGKPVSEVISHAALSGDDQRIRRIREYKAFTKIVIEGAMTRLEDVPATVEPILAKLNEAISWTA